MHIEVTGSGPALVLIHGWALHGGIFAPLVERLAPHFELHVVDLPQVHGLAMLAATPRFVRDADWPNAVEPVVFEQFGRDLEQDYRGTLERFLALDVMGSQHARSELRTLRDALVERGEPAPRALHEGLALLERSDLRGGLPGLHKPGLWIGGQRDRLVPSKAMHQAAALAPAGLHSAHTIEGGGHAPFLGHADHVAGLLQQFVAGCA
jgi:pimeloyl-[acyl-carrier protein] methyl ester esterase